MRDRTYKKVLEQGIAAFEVNIRPIRQVRSLLKEDGVGSIYLAHVDRYFLHQRFGHVSDMNKLSGTNQFLRRKDRVHNRNVRRRQVWGYRQDEYAWVWKDVRVFGHACCGGGRVCDPVDI